MMQLMKSKRVTKIRSASGTTYENTVANYINIKVDAPLENVIE